MEAVSIFLWSLLEALTPVIVMVAVPLILALVYRLTGVQLDTAARAAVQTGITNAAIEAVRTAGGPAVATAVSDAAVQAGVDQVLSGNAESIKRLGMSEKDVTKRVEAQATAIVQSTPNLLADTMTDIAAATVSAALPRIARPAVDVIHRRVDDMIGRMIRGNMHP